MSPWTDLLFAVRQALRGNTTPGSVARYAERCRFVAREAHGVKASLYNALKTMAEAWPDEPALSAPIAHVVGLCELNPIKFSPAPPRRPAREVPTPWYVERDR